MGGAVQAALEIDHWAAGLRAAAMIARTRQILPRARSKAPSTEVRMSLNAVISSGLSGLNVSQRGLQVASANVTNVNTPGYARVDMIQETRSGASGATAGVDVGTIKRSADRFLASASYSATATFSARSARSDLLDRAQLLLGDPSGEGSVFAAMERTFAGFTALSAEPTSGVRRASTVGQLQTMLSEMNRVGQDVERLRLEADQRIGDAVTVVNGLLSGIASLNSEIQRTRLAGADATSAENSQAGLIDELSSLLEIRVSPNALGGLEVRAGTGEILVGARAVKLSHQQITTFYGPAQSIEVVEETGARRIFSPNLSGGSLAGFIQARDSDIPRVADQLGAFAAAVAETLNAAHNESTAAPAPAVLSGRNTGLIGTDLLSFSGAARIGVIDAGGALQQSIRVNFDNATLSVNGGPAVAFAGSAATATISDLTTALSAAAPGLTASFSGGTLRLEAGAGSGVAVAQDTPAATRAGRGFSHFFGLNDVIQRPRPISFETGLDGAADGFGGGAIVFRVRDVNGNVLQDRSVTLAPGALSAQIAAINSPAGLGGYGVMSGPDADGRVQVQPSLGYTIEIASDLTVRGDTQVSMSALFGLSKNSTAGRAIDLQLNTTIAGAPERLALARPDLSAPIGARVLERGDPRGAQALANAGTSQRAFPANAGVGWQTTTLTQYTANIGAEIGRAASDVGRLRDSAEQIRNVVNERRASGESVKLDDELLRMSQYQQSYSAASRLIQTAREMYDLLLQLV
jgi:flagellar hook-associated protein 1